MHEERSLGSRSLSRHGPCHQASALRTQKRGRWRRARSLRGLGPHASGSTSCVDVPSLLRASVGDERLARVSRSRPAPAAGHRTKAARRESGPPWARRSALRGRERCSRPQGRRERPPSPLRRPSRPEPLPGPPLAIEGPLRRPGPDPGTVPRWAHPRGPSDRCRKSRKSARGRRAGAFNA
jgi:hypothetical protein